MATALSSSPHKKHSSVSQTHPLGSEDHVNEKEQAKSSKHGLHRDGKSSKPGHSGKSGTYSQSAHVSGVNFLFVVNEINLDLHHHRSADQWGNYTPPDTPEGFAEEGIGNVLRYRNGTVSRAEAHYLWYRPELGQEGAIGYWINQGLDELGLPTTEFQPLGVHSTSTVFACGPFLPFVHGMGDATVGDSETFDGWHALHFQHENGISRASSSGGQKFVAGRDAGFIGSLLPRVYRNTIAGAQPSVGLGGELGLVIGLMALSQQPHGAIDTALQHCWAGHQWTGHRHANAWPTVADEPRGVLVQIALDSRGQPGQTRGDIENFEWYGIAVAG